MPGGIDVIAFVISGNVELHRNLERRRAVNHIGLQRRIGRLVVNGICGDGDAFRGDVLAVVNQVHGPVAGGAGGAGTQLAAGTDQEVESRTI